ncbi:MULTISPECIES: hypothetical protein [unclassified Crossiella]|uniref:hypothetical protein n=1 Tax=unclassified Crossiella TaxID=2620835 RepID=UPI001FFE7D1C|nr:MULTISPECIES: hypothetical protein [unclassified Crossiella]MCK2243911.1 hypothetical protein [Crossiella sp. S99.2]MCK2257231.1 hypothetical protein [Crossiella sp. S99.1]
MRRTLPAVSGLLLLTALAACTSGTTTPPPAPAPSSTAAATSAAPPVAKPADATALATAITTAIRGKKTAAASTTVDTQIVNAPTKATAAVRFEDEQVSFTVTGENPKRADVALSAVVLGETTYAKSQESAKKDPAKPWRLLSEKSGRDRQTSGELLEVSSLADTALPSQQLAWFRQGGKLEATAEEKVDGTAATRYTVTIDLAKVAAATTDIQQQVQLESDVKSGITSIKHEIWLTADNLPLRWQRTRPTPGGKPTVGDTRFTDWGKPVEIAAPPAAQLQK